MFPLLKAAFNFSPFQIIIFSLFGLLKYFVNAYQLVNYIQRPLILTLLAFGLIFVTSISISSFIENKQDVTESDNTRTKYLNISNRYSKILNLGITIPAILAFLVFLYMITPTTLTALIVLFIVLVVMNIFRFYYPKTNTEDQI